MCCKGGISPSIRREPYIIFVLVLTLTYISRQCRKPFYKTVGTNGLRSASALNSSWNFIDVVYTNTSYIFILTNQVFLHKEIKLISQHAGYGVVFKGKNI
ncbi:hypothetical protein XENTR_v10022006 [Xenopus tropicalis]|nr:hypothetical protein XENTR_v10022006 [Xenopus tropicalis]